MPSRVAPLDILTDASIALRGEPLPTQYTGLNVPLIWWVRAPEAVAADRIGLHADAFNTSLGAVGARELTLDSFSHPDPELIAALDPGELRNIHRAVLLRGFALRILLETNALNRAAQHYAAEQATDITTAWTQTTNEALRSCFGGFPHHRSMILSAPSYIVPVPENL